MLWKMCQHVNDKFTVFLSEKNPTFFHLDLSFHDQFHHWEGGKEKKTEAKDTLGISLWWSTWQFCSWGVHMCGNLAWYTCMLEISPGIGTKWASTHQMLMTVDPWLLVWQLGNRHLYIFTLLAHTNMRWDFVTGLHTFWPVLTKHLKFDAMGTSLALTPLEMLAWVNGGRIPVGTHRIVAANHRYAAVLCPLSSTNGLFSCNFLYNISSPHSSLRDNLLQSTCLMLSGKVGAQ